MKWEELCPAERHLAEQVILNYRELNAADRVSCLQEDVEGIGQESTT